MPFSTYYYYASMTLSALWLLAGPVGLLWRSEFAVAVLMLSVKYWWAVTAVLLNGLIASSLALRHAESLPYERIAFGAHLLVALVTAYFLAVEGRDRYATWMYDRAKDAVKAEDWDEFLRLLPKLPDDRDKEGYLRREFYEYCYRRPPDEAPHHDVVRTALLHFAHGGKPSIVAAAGCRHDLVAEWLDRYAYSERHLSTALAYARLPETMALLLEAGADPNYVSHNRQTPLMLANSPDIARRLIEAGADPLVADLHGKGMRHFRGRGRDRRYRSDPQGLWWRPEGTPTWTELWDAHGVPPLPPEEE